VFSQSATFGWDSGVTVDPFSKSRTVDSLFAEVRVPVLANIPGAHLLEVSGAVRHEYYSDTTNPTVPKFTLRYLPFNEEVALRGTYSKSFSALCFHHIDPARKDFNISGVQLTTISRHLLELEADKCDVYCLNCHTELHDKEGWVHEDGKRTPK